MIDIVDTELKIVNVVDTDIIRDEQTEKPHYAWGLVGDTWTDVKPLAYAKKEKIAELTDRRDSEDFKLVTTGKGTFDFDDISQKRLNNAIMLTDEGETRNWTLADGTIIEVTKTDLINVIKAGATRSDLIHNKWLALEELVKEATTVEEVEAIKWEDLEPNDEVVESEGEQVNEQ